MALGPSLIGQDFFWPQEMHFSSIGNEVMPNRKVHAKKTLVLTGFRFIFIPIIDINKLTIGLSLSLLLWSLVFLNLRTDGGDETDSDARGRYHVGGGWGSYPIDEGSGIRTESQTNLGSYFGRFMVLRENNLIFLIFHSSEI